MDKLKEKYGISFGGNSGDNTRLFRVYPVEDIKTLYISNYK